jgi:hypothetical protein
VRMARGASDDSPGGGVPEGWGSASGMPRIIAQSVWLDK